MCDKPALSCLHYSSQVTTMPACVYIIAICYFLICYYLIYLFLLLLLVILFFVLFIVTILYAA